MTRPRIDQKTARALFLDRHALGEPPSGPGNGADLQSVIDRLGFVQVDSINTVSRAHHMTLHARRTSYRERNLVRLHDRDRGVFEHWTHDASMISMQFFPHWRLKFRRDEAMLDKQWRLWRRDGDGRRRWSRRCRRSASRSQAARRARSRRHGRS